MSTGFKLVAALLFLVVAPRAVMGEVFEVAGSDSATVNLAAKASTVLDAVRSEPTDAAPGTSVAAPATDGGSRSHRPKEEPQGPSKPRWAIPRRRQLGRELSGTTTPVRGTEVEPASSGTEPSKRERAGAG